MSKMTRIDIIARPEKLEDLKEGLNAIGVQGMTVSQVFGCGLQKGHKEVYRGKEYQVNLVPMIKVETVVCEVPVDLVLDTARNILQTGRVGDGKIFVYDVADCMRIRTGTRGSKAVIDDEIVDDM
ncbi:P-II family nitrogen regulator [Veillonella sp. R32]|uniref:P-II family nitrogen regulator n=1 Tax=Veillonella sp. R32 TaxID=2021312 RepID=UPI001389A877|nr:P-II family nitrogen regulator [Veillonella sp. R32]